MMVFNNRRIKIVTIYMIFCSVDSLLSPLTHTKNPHAD